MTTHIKSFTYEPKIKKILSGECTQTIRLVSDSKREVKVGDEILFHGWQGRPYRSKWSWRLRVKVIQVVPIKFTWSAVDCGVMKEWSSNFANSLARLDCIEPCGKPLGECLRDVLFHVNGIFVRRKIREAQIIRWEVLEVSE